MVFLYLGRVYMVMLGEVGREVKSQNGKKNERKIGQMFKVFTENRKDREYIVGSIS
jgi:hypothetical protein